MKCDQLITRNNLIKFLNGKVDVENKSEIIKQIEEGEFDNNTKTLEELYLVLDSRISDSNITITEVSNKNQSENDTVELKNNDEDCDSNTGHDNQGNINEAHNSDVDNYEKKIEEDSDDDKEILLSNFINLEDDMDVDDDDPDYLKSNRKKNRQKQKQNKDIDSQTSSPGRPKNPRPSSDVIDSLNIQKFTRECIKTDHSSLKGIDIHFVEVVSGNSIDFSKFSVLSDNGNIFIQLWYFFNINLN